jgi:hypothetical protein
VGQAAGIHQLVHKYLTSVRVQAQQTARLRQSEAETRKIEVFAQQPPFHMFQSRQFHSPLGAKLRGKARANAVSQSHFLISGTSADVGKRRLRPVRRI